LTLKKPTCKKLNKIIATEVCSSWNVCTRKKNNEKLNIYSYKCLLFAI